MFPQRGERKLCLEPTFSEPLVEGAVVEPDLDGGAVPRPRAGEGLGCRRRRRERDGARGAQQAPGLQPRERGVHQSVPLRHLVERAARVGRRRSAHAERRRRAAGTLGSVPVGAAAQGDGRVVGPPANGQHGFALISRSRRRNCVSRKHQTAHIKENGGPNMFKKPNKLSLKSTTPSVPNYKSFQEFWRVKPFQNLTKIIEKNIKIYDIK